MYHLGIALVGVSLAFGLTVLTMVYAIGRVSGYHLNSAVSVGSWTGGHFPVSDPIPCIIAQVLSGIAGAGGIIYTIYAGKGDSRHSAGSFAAAGFSEHSSCGYGLSSTLASEVIMTFFFPIIILGSTHKNTLTGFAPIAIGLCLTLIHLIRIPVTNISVNSAPQAPARRFSSVAGPLFATVVAFSDLRPSLAAVMVSFFHLWMAYDHPALACTMRQYPSGQRLFR